MAITKTSERLFFCFESQAIRMPCTVFSCQPTSSPASSFIPTIAYLERDSLRVDRKASLDHIRIPRPTMRPSRPTASLYRAHLARITPADPIRDPYIAALLMALAQSQRRNLIRAGGLPANPNSFRVHVLVGDATDETRLHVYTANIPAASLDRLADSRWIPRAPISFVVHATEVPFGPYSSFQQRLLQTMFPEDKKRRRDAGTSRAEGVKVARVG
ncbi:hypothetical protein CPLU01_15104 [Colletotrichum plurivorum]|uniref:Uncharacterized protein n=1 Tax=Colletotrichum plurivorum TaxID=2175906 RepID=A0A8H6JE73_9PEZI|nr:hypothetical protein CPLU01_15104 [Colletotrichum plurivorum]